MRSLATLTAAVLLIATGCSGEEPEAAPTPAPSVTPTVAPTPQPSQPPDEPALDPLDWESAVHGGQPGELVRVGRQFFGVETRAVARLTATGADVWRFQGPGTDDFRGFVVDGIPVVAPRKGRRVEDGYQPHLVQGLDPRTGEVRWTRESTSSYTFSDGEHVVAPTCSGVATGALGDCTLTAYDARTGDVVWTRATWANVEIAQAGDGYTLLQTFPRADDPRYLVLEPDGDVRAEIDLVGGGLLSPVGDRLVTDGPSDLGPAAGCRQQVTAFDLDGDVAWRRTFRLEPAEDTPQQCDTWSAIGVEDGVALVGERPAMLLEPRRGRTVWRGTVAGSRVYASWDGVVLDEDPLGQRTVGVDSATGAEQWSFEDGVGGWRTWRGYATSNYQCDDPDSEGSCTVVLDARTGEVLLRVPGVPRTFVPPAGDAGAGLLTRIDKPSYTATYGYVTLPPLPDL